MPHPLRQVAGALIGMFASIPIYYVLLVVIAYIATGSGGSFDGLLRELMIGVPNRATFVIISAGMLLSATACAGYIAGYLRDRQMEQQEGKLPLC